MKDYIYYVYDMESRDIIYYFFGGFASRFLCVIYYKMLLKKKKYANVPLRIERVCMYDLLMNWRFY